MSHPVPQQGPQWPPRAVGDTAPHGGLWPSLSVRDRGLCPRPGLPGEEDTATTPPLLPAQEVSLKLNLRLWSAGLGVHRALPAPQGPPGLGAHPGFGRPPRVWARAEAKALEQVALLSQQRRGRRSDGKRARRRGGKNNTGSPGIVRGNLLSCCLQTLLSLSLPPPLEAPSQRWGIAGTARDNPWRASVSLPRLGGDSRGSRSCS